MGQSRHQLYESGKYAINCYIFVTNRNEKEFIIQYTNVPTFIFKKKLSKFSIMTDINKSAKKIIIKKVVDIIFIFIIS